MAEIQKRTETVVKKFYRLDLTEEEARVLYTILGKVGGDMDGYSGVSVNIFYALSGEIDGTVTSQPEYEHLTGSLRFDNNKS